MDEDLVLYDTVRRTTHVLNPTGAAFWNRCDGRRTVDGIVDDLSVRFRGDPATVRSDVTSLVATLTRAGLLGEALAPRAAASHLPRPSGLQARLDRAVDDRRWAWTSPPMTALDYSFRVRCDDAPLSRFLEDTLAPLGTPGGTVTDREHRYTIRRHGAGLRLVLDGRTLHRADDAPDLARFLLWHVNRSAVEASPRLLVLHAAAAQADGVTVLLPAWQNAGKSTLVAALVRHGLAYLSDEAIGIRPADLVARPYPKAITVDRGSWEVLADLTPQPDPVLDAFRQSSWQLPPATIGPGAIGVEAPIDTIVFPRYREHGETELEALSPTEALTELLANAFDFPALGQEGLDALARLARATPAWRLASGDLDEARDAVLAAMGRTAAPGTRHRQG